VPVDDSPGVHDGWRAGGTTVVLSQSLGRPGELATVHRAGRQAVITSCAETPVVTPRVELVRLGERALRTAVLLPSWHRPGSRPLPVLMDPYGGPAAQEKVAENLLLIEADFLKRALGGG
jgi:dipeptidyl-peptidase 4